MATSNDPFDRLDELMRLLAEDQAKILAINAEALAAYQQTDAEYSPRLNPLYRHAQDTFDELRRLSEAHSSELLVKDRKSSRRNSGVVGWRLNSTVIQHVDKDELVRRIKAMGQTLSRKLLRRTVSWDLRLDNIKSVVNQEIVGSIDGLEVLRKDEFYVSPKNGLRMSTAKSYWPGLDGLSGPAAIATILQDQEG